MDTKAKAQLLFETSRKGVKEAIINFAVDIIKSRSPTKAQLTILVGKHLNELYGCNWQIIVGKDIFYNFNIAIEDMVHVRLDTLEIIAFKII